jgi:hypothetical protein
MELDLLGHGLALVQQVASWFLRRGLAARCSASSMITASGVRRLWARFPA